MKGDFYIDLIIENMTKQDILRKLRYGIVASVQASAGEPLNSPEILAAIADSTIRGGAVGVRLANVDNIQAFKRRCPDIPVIGITKPPAIPENSDEIVYITPTCNDAALLAEAGADIVAMDATTRQRPGGESLSETVHQLKRDYPDLLLMADISKDSEGTAADRVGFDLISTTLSGYTTNTKNKLLKGPDFELLAQLAQSVSTPVILEGRLWDPKEVRKAFAWGAYAVVIGSAISRPHEITRRFVQATPKG